MLLTLTAWGCGKRGGLVPAWTAAGEKTPRPVTDLAAEVRGGRVWVTWTEPVENTDLSRPANVDVYVVYYEVLPIETKYCLECPLDLSRNVEVDPNRPSEASFEGGRVAAPVASFEKDKKYIFIVLALNADNVSAGDSNVATLNWPLTPGGGE